LGRSSPPRRSAGSDGGRSAVPRGASYRGLSLPPGVGHLTCRPMSWARSLPGPVRRGVSRLVHAAWEVAGELGAIGPDDPRGRRFGAIGRGTCLLFPQGAIYNEHHIQIGEGTMVGPNTCLT